METYERVGAVVGHFGLSDFLFAPFEVPETMPAHDVTVTGSFTVDGIEEIVTERLVDVYTLQGVTVKLQISVAELRYALPKGVYIVNGKRIAIK